MRALGWRNWLLAAQLGATQITPVYGKDMQFSVLLRGADLGQSLVVQVDPEDKLVLDAGVYDLGGKDLVILAEKATVQGEVLIRAFDPTSTPVVPEKELPKVPDTPPTTVGYVAGCSRSRHGTGCAGIGGTTGLIGGVGKAGATSGTIVVDIGIIDRGADSLLKIVAVGQKGAKGGRGEQGGQGATGQTGDDAGEAPGCETAGQGGMGGPGGQRGSGGIGGTGGDGGEVRLSQVLLDAYKARENWLEISVAGGSGGDPGDPGQRGLGGFPGARGSGSRTCIQHPTSEADDGPLGPDSAAATPPSASGGMGQIGGLQR